VLDFEEARATLCHKHPPFSRWKLVRALPLHNIVLEERDAIAIHVKLNINFSIAVGIGTTPIIVLSNAA
jgi:hypothetical protein